MSACETIDVMRKFIAVAGACVLASLILGSAPAYAHAALVSTDPGNGAQVAKAPAVVTLTFSENIATPAFIVVTAPDGSRVKTGKATVLDHTISSTLPAVDFKGRYSVSFRVVSADSHPVEGSTSFVVTTGRTVTAAPPAKESFVQRHQSHLLWGLLGAAVAVGLLLWPLRRARS